MDFLKALNSWYSGLKEEKNKNKDEIIKFKIFQFYISIRGYIYFLYQNSFITKMEDNEQWD